MNPDNPFASAAFLQSAAGLDHLPADDRPEVAFAGRSNAGKSSALNVLCGRRNLARVSKTPGRTQLLNFFTVDLSPETPVRLVDLPGYGYAKVPHAVREQWGQLVSGFIAGRQMLRGIVVVMDARHPMGPHDRQLLEWVRPCPVHVLLTKSDKLRPSEARKTLEATRQALAETGSVQLFSSLSRMGVEDARAYICNWLQGRR